VLRGVRDAEGGRSARGGHRTAAPAEDRRGAPARSPGGAGMTDDQAMDTVVDRVAELLHERIGLRADASLRGRLRRAVRDEASRHGRELMTYVDSLAPGTDALQDLVNRVTVQETAFFRHSHQFDVLAREVLPVLPQPVTIW